MVHNVGYSPCKVYSCVSIILLACLAKIHLISLRKHQHLNKSKFPATLQDQLSYIPCTTQPLDLDSQSAQSSGRCFLSSGVALSYADNLEDGFLLPFAVYIDNHHQYQQLKQRHPPKMYHHPNTFCSGFVLPFAVCGGALLLTSVISFPIVRPLTKVR